MEPYQISSSFNTEPAMNTTETTTTISSLPDVITFDILSRLCIQDLSPCRFICKDWYNIIRDPVFVDSHHSRIDKDDPTFIITHHEISIQEDPTEIFSKEEKEEKLFLVDNKSMTCKPMAASLRACLPQNFVIVGSSNGLLCLKMRTEDQSYFIMNPVTKEIVSLPRAPRVGGSESKYRFFKTGAFGFAYNATSKTYKVVRTWSFYPRYKKYPVLVIDMHTFGSGKWRRHAIFDASTFWDRTAVFVKNALHWLIFNRQFGKHVCALDVGAETFTRFKNLPYTTNVKSLGTINECLAFFAETRGELLVWVMKDYGIGESWTKEYTICLNRPPDDGYPLNWIFSRPVDVGYPLNWIFCEYGLKNNGSTLFFDGEHLRYFDFENKDKQVIDIQGIPHCESSKLLGVVAHVGSLVSPKSIATGKEITLDMPSDDWKVISDTDNENESDDASFGFENEDESEDDEMF